MLSMMGVTVGGRILVVDDEPALREIARELLTGAGYAVAVCSNGREALEALQRESYDAVLSDVRMPDMDGLGLLRAVREKDLDVPVVLWTGGPSVETAAEAVEHGALQYLIKPVPFEKLLEAASRAVKLGTLARLKREALVATGFDQLVGDRAGLEDFLARALDGVWMAYQPIVRARERGVRLTKPSCAPPTRVPHSGRPPRRRRAPRSPPRAGRSDPRPRRRDSRRRAGARSSSTSTRRSRRRASSSTPRAPLSRFASRVVLEITERAPRRRSPTCPAPGSPSCADGLPDRDRRPRRRLRRPHQLRHLEPEIVKLDMSLVRGVDRDTVRLKLVGSIAALCRDLGILVVAEGIETEGEREAAARSGCDLLQGFLIGRPSRIGQA